MDRSSQQIVSAHSVVVNGEIDDVESVAELALHAGDAGARLLRAAASVVHHNWLEGALVELSFIAFLSARQGEEVSPVGGQLPHRLDFGLLKLLQFGRFFLFLHFDLDLFFRVLFVFWRRALG